MRFNAAQHKFDIGISERFAGCLLQHIKDQTMMGHTKSLLRLHDVLGNSLDRCGELRYRGSQALDEPMTYLGDIAR